ncbi:hypothetical protein [Paludisphaera sp.]|uniref:hypothetical protein n=1 Tax=Paludisphaera sp. TaxID=2017432 RepID=UPI00301CD3D5
MIRPTIARFSLILALGCAAGVPARAAGLLDFETRPDGAAPTDGGRLVNPYMLEGGGSVRMFFDRNGNNVFDDGVDALPVFERIGNNGTDGFVATTAGRGLNDQVREGSGLEDQLGEFFLRQPDGIGVLPGPFVIDYDTDQVIREFSGEIWDIDAGADGRFEQWRVDVLDGSGSVLRTLLSPEGVNNLSGLDSLPWTFGFEGLPDGVRAIRLTFVGTKVDGIGLAFNNFSPTIAVPGSVAVPEPSGLALGASAAGLGLAVAFRRRRA